MKFGVLLAMFFLCGSILATDPPTVEDAAAEPTRDRLTIHRLEGCPIQILPRKTRIVDPDDLMNRTEGRPAAREMYKRKFYGATERQVVYDLAFRNESEQNLLAVAFVWSAFDRENKTIFQHMSHYGSAPLPPRQFHALHDLDLLTTGEIDPYEVSVLMAVFEDGTKCGEISPIVPEEP